MTFDDDAFFLWRLQFGSSILAVQDVQGSSKFWEFDEKSPLCLHTHALCI